MNYKIIQPTSLTDGIGLNQLRNELDDVLDLIGNNVDTSQKCFLLSRL